MAVDCDQIRPGVRRILLNRPERLNANDDAFVDELHAAIDAVEADLSCRAVVLTGAGRGFCAGFDMKGGDYDGDPASRPLRELLAGQKRLSRTALRLHELPQAVIAAVNGPAAASAFGTWMTKELLDGNEDAGSLRQALAIEDRTQVLCNFAGDVAEAVAAFRDGRPPRASAG